MLVVEGWECVLVKAVEEELVQEEAGRRTRWWRRWRAPVVLHVLVTAAEQAPSGCRVSSPVADCILPHLGFWM